MQTFNKNEIDIVIYHSPCYDGFGSAYVVWKYYQELHNDREIEYIGVGYGSKMPDVKDKNVLICDYSYPMDVMNDILQESKSVLVIDHHKTAQKELEQLSDEYKIFDMDHSGVILTWKYFYGEDKVAPMVLQYIEDRDIWKKELPNNEEFVAWFYNLDMEFSVFDDVCNSPDLLQKGIERGRYYLELNDINKKSIAKHAVPKFVKFKNNDKVEYQIVAHVNSNVLRSDVGNAIFDVYPFIDLSTVYSTGDSTNETTFSLRSTNHHVDVGTLSKEYLRGGGHRNASGASIPAITTCISPSVYDASIYGILRDGLYYRQTEDDRTVVYLNTTHSHYALGKYLLQTKYIKNGDRKITNAVNIRALNATLKEIPVVDWKNGSAFMELYQDKVSDIADVDIVILWRQTSDNIYHSILYQNMDKDVIDKYLSLYRECHQMEDYVEDDGYCSFTTSSVQPNFTVYFAK